MTAEQRAVQDVMAGRRTKTIRQIVDHAAHGGSTDRPDVGCLPAV